MNNQQPEKENIPEEKRTYVKKQETITKFYQEIGINIYKARHVLKFSQEELGDKLGISRVSVNNIENGKQRLPVHLLHEVSKYLKITLDELLHGIKPIEPTKEAPLSNNSKVGESIYTDPGHYGSFVAGRKEGINHALSVIQKEIDELEGKDDANDIYSYTNVVIEHLNKVLKLIQP